MGRRSRRSVPDLRMGGERLKPTGDVDVVEPNVSGGSHGVVERRERGRLGHFFGEFGASTAC